MRKFLVIALLGVLSLGMGKAAGCESTSTEFDSLYCAVQLYVQADKELNDAYRDLMGKLNKEGQGLLRAAQIKWIAARDQASGKVLDGQRVFYMDTATQMTTERTTFLKARLRECNSTGCVNSKLK